MELFVYYWFYSNEPVLKSEERKKIFRNEKKKRENKDVKGKTIYWLPLMAPKASNSAT